ncbi:hypothetical protein CVT24_008060 [Panaeolus cyanescens]|uniref:Anti-proliferative protein domain-containing protein n=1 Tax=Panaeolus cyanescens TaxID=181874 RepID=A0A409W086_9AGAR|nr:hypothetical protein CVT24_008060 [Panaeolus cyanescens]
MSSINVQAPLCVVEAVDFLVRPLYQTSWVSFIASIKSMLVKSLSRTFMTTNPLELSISFARNCTSPQIIATAEAFGISWYDWHQGLGAKEMQLHISNSSVTYTIEGDLIPSRLIWSMSTRFDRFLAEPPVPISKFGKLARVADKVTMHAYLGAVLLADEKRKIEELKEANDILAQASPFAILSPTPTRECFPAFEAPRRTSGLWRTAFPSPLSLPESVSPCSSPEDLSPASSRPSSRSSDFSTFSSYSDEESMTSASSISSFDFLSTVKPAFAAPFQKAQIAVSAPAPIAVYVPPARKIRESAPAPTPEPAVVIEKKEVTKYLYQGGVSTTLSGGVMLGGAPKSAAPRSTPARAPLPRGSLPQVPHSAPPRFTKAMRAPVVTPARLPTSTQVAIAQSILSNPDPMVFSTPSKASKPAPIGTGRRVPSKVSPASAAGSWRRGPSSARA